MFKCWSDRGFGGSVASVPLLGYPLVLHFIKLDFLMLCLFQCKIFSNVKYFILKIFSVKYFHFTVFGSLHENVQEITL